METQGILISQERAACQEYPSFASIEKYLAFLSDCYIYFVPRILCPSPLQQTMQQLA